MAEHPTCGEGLAEHSALPAKLGELIAAMAENLEVHMQALDSKDPDARREHRMAGYRDLPMGRHDEKAMAGPEVLAAFETFVRAKQELLELLRKSAEQDQRMLAAMRGASGGT
ncbi:MAG TPA: hypothetical protein VF121_10085 [Thermoanaerobaculia bacterium]|nr:hypothetical protein [Thermoanaerobaculia bacterium]